MPKTEKQQQAANDYLKTVDRIVFYAPKGSKSKIQRYADGENISVNELVVQSIEHHTGLTIKPERTTDTDGKK